MNTGLPLHLGVGGCRLQPASIAKIMTLIYHVMLFALEKLLFQGGFKTNSSLLFISMMLITLLNYLTRVSQNTKNCKEPRNVCLRFHSG